MRVGGRTSPDRRPLAQSSRSWSPPRQITKRESTPPRATGGAPHQQVPGGSSPMPRASDRSGDTAVLNGFGTSSVSVLVERLLSPLQRMQQMTQSQVEQLQRETDARLLQLESRVVVLEESVAPRGESMEETVSQQIEHLAGLHDQLNKTVDERGARNEERLAAVQAQLDTTLETSRQELSAEQQERVAAVGAIKGALAAAEERLQKLSRDDLNTAVQALQAEVDSSAAVLQSAFDTRADAVERQVEVLASEMDTVSAGQSELQAEQTAARQAHSDLESTTIAKALAFEARLDDGLGSLRSQIQGVDSSVLTLRTECAEQLAESMQGLVAAIGSDLKELSVQQAASEESVRELARKLSEQNEVVECMEMFRSSMSPRDKFRDAARGARAAKQASGA